MRIIPYIMFGRNCSTPWLSLLFFIIWYMNLSIFIMLACLTVGSLWFFCSAPATMHVVELFMLVDFNDVQMWYLYHGYMDERFHRDLENIWTLCSKMWGAVLLVSWGLDRSSRFLPNSWFPFFRGQCFISSFMILTEKYIVWCFQMGLVSCIL